MGPVPNDLKKFNDVVEKDVVTKDVHDELVKSVNAIETSKLTIKTDCNAKTKGVEDKTASVTNLANTAAFCAVENKLAQCMLVI